MRIEANPAERALGLRGGTSVMSGSVEPRPEGTLKLSEPRELIVRRDLRAAFRPDGSVDEETMRWWGAGVGRPIEEIAPLADLEVVDERDEEVLWGGSEIGHFGHFLIESAARLWPLLPGGPCESMPTIITTPLASPFICEWLDAFGLDTVRLPEEGAVRFRRVTVPEPAWRIDGHVAPEMRAIHLHARSGLGVPDSSDADVVWLSRSKIVRERRVRDEALIEWLLNERISVVHPERLTLAEQVGMIESARAITGPIGSAFHTLLLARELPEVVYLTSGRVPSPFVAQDWLLGSTSAYAQALGVEELRLRPRRRREGSRLLVPEALRTLDAMAIPGLLEDERLARFARPELPVAVPGPPTEPELDTLARRALLDQNSLSARMELGVAFEEAGLDDCALEQFFHVAELTDDYAYAPLRAARLLARQGETGPAAEMARAALAIDPDSEEAAGYAAA